MRFKNLLIVFILCVLASTATSQMVGGQIAGEDEYNYLVFVDVHYMYPGTDLLPSSFYGGGVIVNEKWVLTAAHNFNDDIEDDIRYPPYEVVVKAGSKIIDSEEEHTQRKVVRMSAVIIHEVYKRMYQVNKIKFPYYDIALVFLGRDTFQFIENQVEPARLVEPNLDIADNTRVTVVGWGVTGAIGVGEDMEEIEADRAYKGNLNFIPDEVCEWTFGPKTFDEYFHSCYGCLEGTCSMMADGDSGSPVVMNRNGSEIVVGIVQGSCTDMWDKCSPESPGMGMDLRKFRDWMDEKMQIREARFARENVYMRSMGLAAVAATLAFAFYYNY